MRRKSERGKTKPVPKEESPEKASTRKTNRHHPRRRRKSSSSSGSESKSPKKDIETTSQPLEVQVQDIELPQEENPAPSTTVTNKSKETQNTSSENQKEWKEDNTFWESGDQKPAQEVVAEDPGSGKDKEGSSLWKIESANGAGGGGEIQKLKICRQRPTESPELVENPVHKRLSRGAKDGRSTDDSTHEESEKDTKQLKHRTRTSSRNSPLVSPTIVCDMSEGSPTKIKIINVSHINTENKGESVVKTPNDETVTVESAEKKVTQVKEDSHHNDTLDIALPADQPSLQKPPETNTKEGVEQKIEESIPDNNATSNSETTKTGVEKPTDIKQPESIVEDNSKNCSEKLTSSISSPKKEDKKLRSSRSSSADSDSSNNKSKVRKVKKKRRRELQSSVQRKRSSDSPKHESSDTEDGDKKREAERRGSTETQTVKSSDKENEADNSLRTKDNSVKESNEEEEKLQRRMPRKRRWGSSIANRANKKPILSISTDSLKSLIPDAKLVSAEELQLSVEEEEGQLDDDEEDDEVVIFVAKEEEKQLERERQRDEKLKEREKELEEKRKKKERLEKIKLEKPPPEQTATDSAPRKILLLTEDAKKLARSPSPPRHRPASVLYITHLVRPFTVQQLKNLLLRTGTITENGFWIDKIKSKCYVEYTTEDAAVETRHALHGVRWPTSNPKTLVVEFASHDDLVMAQALSEELPEVPRKAEPLNMVEGWVAEQARIKERTRRAVVREWDVGKPEHPDEVLEYDMKMKEKREQERKARKERPHRSATPDTEVPARKARRKEEDAPAKLLDDLFRKTKTSPCIYWLPLTQEQIAVKEEIRRQHMAEHERRMAELKKVELARRERERRNRK